MAGDHGRQLQLSILGDTGTCKSATHSWQVARVNSYDVFHTWHLGVGKYWTASILECCLLQKQAATSMRDRVTHGEIFELLQKDFYFSHLDEGDEGNLAMAEHERLAKRKLVQGRSYHRCDEIYRISPLTPWIRHSL